LDSSALVRALFPATPSKPIATLLEKMQLVATNTEFESTKMAPPPLVLTPLKNFRFRTSNTTGSTSSGS
jgi:hypothetical protein